MNRIVVIGTGFGRRVIAPTFSRIAGCEVVDLVSARDPAAAEAVILSAKPDLVCVHAPPQLHARYVEYAASIGTHAILCDKPFGDSVPDAQRMLDAIHDSGSLHFVNFEFRCSPPRQRLRELLDAGAVGTLERITWLQHSSGSRQPLRWHNWLFDHEQGGGWIGAWASHTVDSLRWLLSDEITVDFARPSTMVRERPDRGGTMHPSTAEDTLSATVHSIRRGIEINIDSTFAAAINIPGRITVFGSDGIIELVNDRWITVRRANGTQDTIDTLTDEEASLADPHELPMSRWAHKLIEAMNAHSEGSENLPTFDDGLACAKVLDALRSYRQPGV